MTRISPILPLIAMTGLPSWSRCGGEDGRFEHETLLRLRQTMIEVIGSLPGKDKRCPLDLRVDDESDQGTYVRRHVTYQAEPGDRVPAWLLIPKAAITNQSHAFPAMLCLHQTHAQGYKVVVGLGDSPDDEYGVELVRRGYVCLAPAYPLLAEYHPDLRALGHPGGTIKAIWNNIRGLDLLESMPCVHTNGFGSIGHSLGGHNGLFTSVFDTRLRIVVSSCGFDSFRDYKGGDLRGWTGPRYMPQLARHIGRPSEVPFDFSDILTAVAPRAVFVAAPLDDTNFLWTSVDRIHQEARARIKSTGGTPDMQVEHPPVGHRFPPELRQKAYRMIDRILNPPEE